MLILAPVSTTNEEKDLKAKRPANRLVKKALPLYVDESVRDELKALSERTRVPQQVYLREGVDLVLKKYKGAK
jgi:hypothetical protein